MAQPVHGAISPKSYAIFFQKYFIQARNLEMCAILQQFGSDVVIFFLVVFILEWKSVHV